MERKNEFVGIVSYLEINNTRQGFVSVRFKYNSDAKAEMAVYGYIPKGVDIGSKIWVKGQIDFGMDDDNEVYFDFYAKKIKLLDDE